MFSDGHLANNYVVPGIDFNGVYEPLSGSRAGVTDRCSGGTCSVALLPNGRRITVYCVSGAAALGNRFRNSGKL